MTIGLDVKLANLLRGNDRGAVTLRLLVSTTLVAASGGAGALALGSAASAAALPSGFTLQPILDATTGLPICDILDNSPDQNDIACNGGISTYFGIDANTVAASIVLEIDPRDSGTPGPIESTTYVVLLAVGGTHVASFGIDGKGTNDTDYLYAGCLSTGISHNVKASTALADNTITVAPDGPYFRLTFNVPRSAFSCIPAGTSIAPFVGTSQAGPLDNINKDFFVGNSVNFGAVNLRPDAVNDTRTVAQDSTGNAVDVLANDSDDQPKSALSVVVTTAPANGTATWNATTREVDYTPNAGFSGADSFGYTITDAGGLTDSATVAVTVTPTATPNVAPDAVNDTRTVAQDSTGNAVDVLANDSDDQPKSALSVVVTTAPSNGTATWNATTREVDYTPNAGFSGADSFGYTITDAGGLTDSATVAVTVTPTATPNVAPDAVNDTRTVAQDSTGNAVDVLANDSDDQPKSALSVVVTTAPSNGTATWNATTREVDYTPNAGFSGADKLGYTITDAGGLTDSATVAVTVTPTATPNVAPDAVNDTRTVAQDSTGNAVDVLANDSDDQPKSALSVVVTTAPSNGTATWNATTREVDYTPNAGFSGADSFGYTITDAGGLTDSATVAVTVTPTATPNVAPDAVNDTRTVAQDSTGNAVDVLANDSDDQPKSALSVVVTTAPSNGTATWNATTREVDYTPNAGFSGADSFGYTITDAGGLTDSATVAVTVTPTAPPANTGPVAVNDARNATTGGPAMTIDVLVNDTDADSDPLTITSVTTSGTLGAVSLSLIDNEIRYTPPAIGSTTATTDSFTYTISDGKGGSSTATVTVALARGNRLPDAVNDAVITGFGSPVNVSVLSNDSDPDGDVLTITGVGGAANGTVSQAGGVLTYTPNAGFSGTDSFTYTISDGRGGSDSALVTVSVGAAPVVQGPVVQPPVTVSDAPAASTAPSPAASPTAEASPSAEATAAPTAEASPIAAVTSPEPATGEEPTEEPSSPPSVTPIDGVQEESATAPATPRTLPFTGGSTDAMLALAASLSLAGLVLALAGRRRRTAG